MKIELNQIVQSFTSSCFRVRSVYRYKVPAGRQGRQKTAPCAGFLFPLSGKAQFGFDGEQYVTNTQKVIHGGADMDLEKKVVSKTDLEYISILYDVDQKSATGLHLVDSHFELEIGQSLRLKGLLNRLWKISHMPGAMSEFQKETLFHCILEEMFVCAENRAITDDRNIFLRTSSYIHDNFSDGLTVSELAELFEINTNRLYYLFTKYAGVGPGDYLIAYRINRAKEYLLTTEMLVHEVAGAVGYTDPLHFSRIFKKHFGCSPSEVRKTFRNNPYSFQEKTIPAQEGS